MGEFSGVRGKLRWVRQLMAMDRVAITLHGDADAWSVYRDVTQRHPKLRVRMGGLGASLVRLTAWDGGYLEGASFADARRKVRRAEKAGYTVRPIRASAYRDEILDIHRSATSRQGAPMLAYTQTEEGVAAMVGDRRGNGVFDPDGHLRGYMLWIDAGELIMLRGLMGHAEVLRHGIMYHLFCQTIRQAIEAADGGSGAKWLQYTFHHRHGDGMRRFKHEVGFRPYIVTWSWSGHRPGEA